MNRKVLLPKIRTLKLFDILGFIKEFDDLEVMRNDDDRIMAIQNKMKRYSKSVREVGVHYSSTQPVSTVNSLLRLIGFKLKKVKTIRDGKETHGLYKLEKLPDFTKEILNYFLTKEISEPVE